MINCKIIYEPTSVIIGWYAFSNYPSTNSVINIQGRGKYLITRVEHVFNTSLPVSVNGECRTDIYVKNINNNE